jgi:hypothetical protein
MKDLTQAQQDRRFRKALEARSIDQGRADVAGSLNRLAVQDGMQQSAGVILSKLRLAAQGRRRTVGDTNARHDAMLAKAVLVEKFNRLHPLARRTPASPTSDIPVGERDDARDDRIGPDLRDHVRVTDAGGRMDADARTRESHFAGQGGRELGAREFKADLNLSVEQMRALATALVTHSRYF